LNDSKRRTATVRRNTSETDIAVDLTVDGAGNCRVDTGIGFLDHLVRTLCFHAGFDVDLNCRGDLDVDDHHTAEDAAMALGEAFDGAMGERDGIARFAHAFAPLDEALARVVVDLARRPFARTDLGLKREFLGGLSTENVSHFFTTFAVAGRFCCHVDVICGDNDHHRAEAAFKAAAIALRQAVRRTGATGSPSTKGSM
jgi:imidazoleglycerol phosphate dehydratase HisB